MSKLPEFEIIHLDDFPCGGACKVQFKIGIVDITKAMSELLDAYWKQFCDSEIGCPYDASTNVAIIHTGESYWKDDFKLNIEDIIALLVTSREGESIDVRN